MYIKVLLSFFSVASIILRTKIDRFIRGEVQSAFTHPDVRIFPSGFQQKEKKL